MQVSTAASLFFVALLATTQGSGVANKVKVTPVEKVIVLMEKLKEQCAAEGQAEAKVYDETACFCKQEADDKHYNIGKCDKEIKDLTSKIEVLDAEISDLNAEVQSLIEKKEELETKQVEDNEIRKKEFDMYSKEAADLAETIKRVEGAIEALESSKEGMEGAKLNLAQLKEAVSRATTFDPKRLQALLSTLNNEEEGQKPHASKFASNDIIATLKGLLKQFKNDKTELDTSEADVRSTYEMTKQSRENTIKFTAADTDDAKKLGDQKSKEKQQKETERTETQAERDADQEYLNKLMKKCEDQAKAFDQRSNARTGEITALTKAIEIMKSGVQPVALINQKLALANEHQFVSEPQAVAADSLKEQGKKIRSKLENAIQALEETKSKQEEKNKEREFSFVQLRGSTNGPKQASLDALTFLTSKASSLKSPTLSMVAVKMQVELGKDHFVKVRGMIKDLIAKLENDAKEEAGEKSFCDEKMGEALSARDEAIGTVELQTANIDDAESTIAKLTEEITELGDGIAGLRKSLFEQTELRDAERAENAKTLEDAKAGLTAVKQAIKVLKDFYNALIQQGSSIALFQQPAISEEEYAGNQDAAAGIFALLDVIMSDFKREIDTTTTEDEEAEDAYVKFEDETKTDLKDKEKEKGDKEEEKKNTEADLIEFKDVLKDAQQGLSDAKEELEKLKPMCVDQGESWEEKRARQKAEIEALKEALAILSEI